MHKKFYHAIANIFYVQQYFAGKNVARKKPATKKSHAKILVLRNPAKKGESRKAFQT